MNEAFRDVHSADHELFIPTQENPIGHRLDVGNTVTLDLPAYKGEMLNVGYSSAGNLLTAKCSNQQPPLPPYPDNLQQSAERCLQSPTSNFRSSSGYVDVLQPGQPKANFVKARPLQRWKKVCATFQATLFNAVFDLVLGSGLRIWTLESAL
ncbi:uncharacterized protein LOC106068676 isoform X1 [Biomphalaria glabrata]|uniref:Uncharacterized protein LOC106068676 isoform X1 n=1 Tax=Biomphalaria glabrata TaxID=6526 RepID=A0A9W2ZS38_BIOGL|nr:uncharacterized protein LOC106068676 isoform X1 [Biomphalaria glabrata]